MKKPLTKERIKELRGGNWATREEVDAMCDFIEEPKWIKHPFNPVAQAPGSMRVLLSALLQPTIEMMQRAGIARMSCGRSKGFVLQMESGEVIELDAPNDKISHE